MNNTAPPPSSSSSSPSPPSAPLPPTLTHEDRIAIVRNHFIQKGYRVHSGLQFGCELVLYADSPGKVHSDFCVHVVGSSSGYDGNTNGDANGDGGGSDEGGGGRLDWRTLQTLVRSMPDLHKTLIVANVRWLGSELEEEEEEKIEVVSRGDKKDYDARLLYRRYAVDELAIGTEHAPFRHKNTPKGVGTQVKPPSRKFK